MSTPRAAEHFFAMGFEKLRVYMAAQLLDAEVQAIIAVIPRGHSDNRNQLKRAMASVLFNIPEAYGSESLGRKRYHLEVARGSADETRSIIRKLSSDGLIGEKAIRKACELSSAIGKMLTAWIDRLPPA